MDGADSCGVLLRLRPSTVGREPVPREAAESRGTTFKLESAPKGMAVDAAGVVTWAVPADATGDHDVILTVRDKSGQDVFHTFTVKLGK